MSSQEFNDLRLRYLELKERFLSFEIPLDREPTSHELDMIASFKLLMHAEIEHFIEGRTTFAFRVSRLLWTTQRRVTRCLLNSILANYPVSESGRSPFSEAVDVAALDALVSSTEKKVAEQVSNNNGIKQSGFTQLAYLAGLLRDELPGTLLAVLESYGRTRGDLAHNPVGKVRSLKAPAVEAGDAYTIITLLQKFDTDISEIVA